MAGAGLAPAAAQDATLSTAPALALGATDGADDLPQLDPQHVQRVRERLDRLVHEQPPGVTTLGGAAAQATGTTNPQVTRRSGVNRYGTAAALADAWWVDYFWDEEQGPVEFEKIAFVASGQAFPDALSGGAAAAAWGGPVLLAKQDGLPKVTADTLRDLQPDAIVVLGGTAAIGAGVEKALHAYVPEPDNVYRVDGKDRWEVSARASELIGWSSVAYVASGVSYADGLAGGAAAGTELAPLLLTKPGDVPGAVMEALRTTVIPERIYVLGGTAAVSDDVVRELDDIAPVTRIEGLNRYEVAARVADLHPSTGGAIVALGQDWPDALAGSAFAGLVGDKLLLVKNDGVPGATTNAVKNHALVMIDALGGTVSIPEPVLQQLRDIEVPTP